VKLPAVSGISPVADRWNMSRGGRAHFVLLHDAVAWEGEKSKTVKAACEERFSFIGVWLATRDVGIVPLCKRCRRVLEKERGA
jgi:hypothetical protein